MNPQQPGGQWPPHEQQPYEQTPPAYGQPAPPPYGGPTAPPNQQYGAPQPAHPQYDFIMSPNAAPRRAIPLAGGSKLTRIAIVGGIAVVAIVLISAVMSFINRPKISSTELTAVAQEQTELIRVATLGSQSAAGQTAKNSAITIQLSITSARHQLLAYMASNNIKVSAKTLALKQNGLTDQQLAGATATSTFDSTFTQIMQSQLASYEKSLKAAYNAGLGPKGRQLTSDEYNSAALLLAQTQQP